MKLLLAILLGTVGACGGAAQPAELRFGTTHTVEQSGALAVLDSLTTPAPLAVVVAPSGQILHAAAAGDLDVVLTHAPALEQRLLVAPGHALLRCPLVVSRFAIVGPASDPAQAARARSAADAFARIAAARAPFISRGDSSGTHEKELSFWTAGAFTRDRAPWYVQAGTDQAATLRIAGERQAYALADLPTFDRTAAPDLRILFTADTALRNRYTLYVVRTSQPHLGASTFGRWAIGVWRERLLARRLPDGTPAFIAPQERDGCAQL